MVFRKLKTILVFVYVIAVCAFLAADKYGSLNRQKPLSEIVSVDRSAPGLANSRSVEESTESSSLIVERPPGVQQIKEFLQPLDGADESVRIIAHDAA